MVWYNFDTHGQILIFLEEILPVKEAIKRRFNMPLQITSASDFLCFPVLPGSAEQNGETRNHIFFFTQMLYYSRALLQLDCVAHTMHH